MGKIIKKNNNNQVFPIFYKCKFSKCKKKKKFLEDEQAYIHIKNTNRFTKINSRQRLSSVYK